MWCMLYQQQRHQLANFLQTNVDYQLFVPSAAALHVEDVFYPDVDFERSILDATAATLAPLSARQYEYDNSINAQLYALPY